MWRVLLISGSLLVPGTSNGSLAVERISTPGGEMSIVWKSGFSELEQVKIRTWLSHAASTTSLLSGEFPLKKTRVYVNRDVSSSGPVPWAHTIRETQPEGVEFHVNPKLSLAEFVADWTAVHEFSHLFIPYPGRRDIWISEGFASYYQNILMARAGVLSGRQAWQKLADGFGRGAKDKNNDLNLRNLSPAMRKRGAYMRVYWSGALYFLEADIQLRKQGQSLDSVVAEFVKCCRNNRKYWNGLKLAQSFDELAHTDLFVPLFFAYQREYQLRDYPKILAKLGIELNNHRVEFVSNDKLQQLREQFTKPPTDF